MRVQLATLAISTAVAASVGWWVATLLLEGTGHRTGVEFVDDREEFARLLAERQVDETADVPPEELLVDEADRDAILEFMKPRGPRYVTDRLVYYRLTAGLDRELDFEEHPDGRYTFRTNSAGFRGSREVLDPAPDLRVVVVGDSHTRGLCSDEEAFAHLLEGELLTALPPTRTVETLNAGVDSHHHYMYVGGLELFGPELAPDVYVVVVFGGNDFAGALKFQRYFRKRPPYQDQPASPALVADAGITEQGFLDQEIHQLCYFLNNPGELAQMDALNRAVSREIARLGELHGSEVLFVYLPPPSRGNPDVYAHDVELVAESLDVASSELELSDGIADRWLEFLEREGLAHLDLRPAFRSSSERLYWKEGHINLAGHRLVARELAAAVQALLGS